MFQTSSHARHHLMSAVAGESEHIWSYVRLSINRPWFFIAYTLHMEDGDIGDHILLSAPEQVVDLFRRNGDEITVRQLMLVSPGHFNQSGAWRMDPLVQIWRGRRGRRMFVYHLADGREILSYPGSRRKPKDVACLVNFNPAESKPADPTQSDLSSVGRVDELFAVRLPH